MKKLFVICLISLSFSACKENKQTEIIIIGTLHKAVPTFNEDVLLNIFEKIKPDFILREQDSAAFTKDFQHKIKQTENEGIASARYVKNHPETQLRPYEFTGRNKHRIDKGMRPTDAYTLRLLDSLYQAELLNAEEAEIMETYHALLEPLKIAAASSPENFNNATNDSICEKRQYYQYQMITKITNSRPEFSERYVIKPDGDSVSYKEGYQLWADFWDTRNQTMAKNILKIAELNPGKRIVVTTGFMHRYYILRELKKYIPEKNIVLKEYYEI